jgi:hypothetical protein
MSSARYLRDDKFVISCAARTGSTMLMFLLGSHEDILCHGEVAGAPEPDRVGYLAGRYAVIRKKHPELEDALWRYRIERPETFLYDIVFDHQDKDVVGFKYKTNEAFDPVHGDIQASIIRDRSIKVIRLRRRNLLAQFISHEALRHGSVMLLRTADDVPSIQPFSIEPKRVIAYIEDVLRRERLIDECYAAHRQISIDYEDLVQPDHQVREDLLSFLGVEQRPLSTPSRKIITDEHALVTNLAEVGRELVRAGHGDHMR